MDMQAYLDRKKAGTVKLQMLAKGHYQLVGRRFCPNTGAEIAPEVAQLDMTTIDNVIKALDEEIEKANAKRAGLVELKSDMNAIADQV